MQRAALLSRGFSDKLVLPGVDRKVRAYEATGERRPVEEERRAVARREGDMDTR